MVRVGQARYLFRLGIGSKSPTQSKLYIVRFLRTLTLWKVFKPYVRRILLRVSLSSNSLIRNGVGYPQKRRGHPFRFSDFLLPVSPSSSGKFCPVFAPQIAAGQWTPSPCACVVSGECGRVTSLMMMMQVLPPVGATPALACPLSESVHPAKVLNAIK